ncbi:MAG TPA: hypothetical protein VFK50_07100 [Sphingomicrobium sp.]|nr:hypothetical protein [Sphingomicrobium sp.]
MAATAILVYLSWFARRSLDRYDLLAAAILSAIMLPFLLPGMHERFFALAEMLAFCLAWLARDRRAIALAVLLQVGAAFSIGGWLLRIEPLAHVAIAMVTTAVMLVLVRVKRFARPARQEGDPMEGPQSRLSATC